MNELINLGNGQFVKVTMLKGEKGSNIATITKTSTSGLVDTYTVTLTDGHTTTFNVTNGSSIESIEKTATVGLVDIYTITLTNGQTSTFEVTNGNAENLQDAFQASQCAIKAGVSQVTFTNLGDAYITYIPNSECVENAVVVVGFDNGSMYKGTMNYSSAIGRWGLSNVELIQGTDVPSTWMVGYGNDSVGTRAFRTGTDFVYSNGIGIALSTSSDVVSYYCVLSGGKVSDNYLQTQIKQINSDLNDKADKSDVNDLFVYIGVSIDVGILQGLEAKWNQTTPITNVPSGYTIFGISGYALSGTNFTSCTIPQLGVSGNNLMWTVANVMSNATGALTLGATVICRKTL